MMTLRQPARLALATLTIAATAFAAVSVTTMSLPGGVVGVAYNAMLAAGGGRAPYTWTISAGSLPQGLALAVNGAISGIPDQAGSFSPTFQATDKRGDTATKTLPLTVAAALSVDTASLPDATLGTTYTESLSASGGTGGYTWSVSTGTLPQGMMLSPTGTIVGIPLAAGTSSFTVQVRDLSADTAARALSISVTAPLMVKTASLPAATVGAAYSQALSASGGTGTYSWSITGGSLPAGLSLAANGTISGTPTAAGPANFTVQVTDSSGANASKPLTLAVNPTQLVITTASLPAATVGAPYSQALAANGGIGSYSWSITIGSLPAGLSLAANGTISGTPTAAGPANFTVQVSDSSGANASKPLTLAVNPAPLVITTASLPAATVGAPYSQALAASGGTGIYSWSITGGSLPAGLSLGANGTISGTPTAAGPANFTVQATDSSGANATKPLTLTVNPAQLVITTASLPAATVGAAYSQALAASGGTGTYSWSVTSGSLPAGLSLAANGTISGIPTAAGPANFTVQVTDSSGANASKPLTLTVNPAQLVITTASLPAATVGAPYSQALAASGGTGTYSWSVISGSLPAGLSLAANGTISGIPTAAGPANFTVQATDSSGANASKSLSLAVNPAQLLITTTSLPDAHTGSTYSASLSAAGGSPPFTWSIQSGQLPAGLSLTPGGGITGSATAAGTFNFTVQVTDSASAHATAALSIAASSALSIDTPPILASGSAGASYNQPLAALGAVPPLAWSLFSGILPTGLSLNPGNGAISGTPTQVGSFSFSVQVKDATGTAATANFNLSISSGVTIATPPSLPPATIGVAYSFTLQPAGGSYPYVWTVTAGSLPAGLTFNSAGLIAGTPTASGNFTFTVQVTDGNSNRATKNFTLTVAQSLSIPTAPLMPSGSTGSPYRQTVTALGGTPPYVWSVVSGALPTGLTLDGSSGIIAGTPSAAGAFGFTLSVTDSASATVQKEFTITIGQGVTISAPASLPDGVAGAAYSFTLAAAGGRAPYSWSVTAGALPAGLALNAAAGTIAGTPSAPGTYNFTLQVTDASQLSASKVVTLVVTLPATPAVAINGLPATIAPLQQPALDIALAGPYPVAITGVLSLAFNPAGPNPADDPSIQFSTGGRTAAFTIPAGASHAVFASPLALQTGSVAGTITLSLASLQAAGSPLTVSGATAQVQVLPVAPVVAGVAMVATGDGFQVQIAGLSTTRELTQATVSFQPATGASLQTSSLVVPLASASQTWFQSSSAAAYGGQFTLTLPFTVTGGTNVVGSVTVILSNSVGDSPASAASASGGGTN